MPPFASSLHRPVRLKASVPVGELRNQTVALSPCWLCEVEWYFKSGVRRLLARVLETGSPDATASSTFHFPTRIPFIPDTVTKVFWTFELPEPVFFNGSSFSALRGGRCLSAPELLWLEKPSRRRQAAPSWSVSFWEWAWNRSFQHPKVEPTSRFGMSHIPTLTPS